MAKKIDRIGETGTNNFGSEMIIVGYRNANDIDIYFTEYDWVAKHRQYNDFKRGQIKCPYESSIYGIGYLGEGEYKAKENGKKTRVYNTWHDMLRRCYDENNRYQNPTYIDCTASKEFYNFQNFGEWDKDNYYEIEGERIHLDKDILVKHNKIYSEETCIYVPQTINNLFVKSDNKRGESPIGTSPLNGKYIAYCGLFNPETGKSKREHLGIYNTQEEAFQVYKYYKEKNIKEVADYFKRQIPSELYQALYNYIVEIDD